MKFVKLYSTSNQMISRARLRVNQHDNNHHDLSDHLISCPGFSSKNKSLGLECRDPDASQPASPSMADRTVKGCEYRGVQLPSPNKRTV